MPQPTPSARRNLQEEERVRLARSSGVMSHGRVRYGPAVSHLDDASRYPDGNGAGRQISDDHATGSHHASVADRDAGKDDRPRADPDVCADHDVLFDPRLTHDG